jgi:hypothetical protein
VAGCPAGLSGRESVVYRAGSKPRFSETELAAAEATYLAWIDLRPLNIDDRALQKVLIEQQKVAIMPGYTYGKEGNGFRSPERRLPAQQAGTRGATPHCRD